MITWRRGAIERRQDTKRGSGIRPHRRPLNLTRSVRALLPRYERRDIRDSQISNRSHWR